MEISQDELGEEKKEQEEQQKVVQEVKNEGRKAAPSGV